MKVILDSLVNHFTLSEMENWWRSRKLILPFSIFFFEVILVVSLLELLGTSLCPFLSHTPSREQAKIAIVVVWYNLFIADTRQIWGQVSYWEHPPEASCRKTLLEFSKGKLQIRVILRRNPSFMCCTGAWWSLPPPVRLTPGRVHMLSRFLHRKVLVSPDSGGIVGFVQSWNNSTCKGRVGRPSAESCQQSRPNCVMRATQLSTRFLI